MEEDPRTDSRDEKSDEDAPEELNRKENDEGPPPSTPALSQDGARSQGTSKNTPASARQHDDRAAMPPPASASKASGGPHSASSLASADISACGPSPDVPTSNAGPERQGPSPGFTKKCTPQRITSAQILLMLKAQPKGAPQRSFEALAQKAAATRAAAPFEAAKVSSNSADSTEGFTVGDARTHGEAAPDDVLSPKQFVQGHGTRGALNNARTAAANAAVIAAAGAAATMEGEERFSCHQASRERCSIDTQMRTVPHGCFLSDA